MNGNGGTVDNVNESILVYKYRIDRGSSWHEDDGRYGYAFAFSKHIPIRSVYEFTGWYADKACTKLVIAADSANMDSDFKKYINANNIFQKEGSENCSENFDMYAGWKKPGATPTPTPKPTVTPTPKPVSGFTDVQDPSHPFYNAIYWAVKEGITKGYPDGTFGINRDCTRGEMMMFLWRYANKPAPKAVAKTPFPDVPKNHAFYNAILWGYQKKITNGFTSGPLKGKFGINENCSRGQIVTFLYRAR